jgi:uncharacterized protein (DUF2126 family)/transglutaminase-like putative cysteine protease
MAIRVALHHRTNYRYTRPVSLGPQLVRLKPAPHCRTPVLSYSLSIEPGEHFCNWQQDPQGNHQARLVFPNPTDHFRVAVDLVADMTVINPFDFFLEPDAEQYPFRYQPWLDRELAPFLVVEPAGPRLQAWIDRWKPRQQRSVDMLTQLNSELQQAIRYSIRLEPGVQAPEQTLELGIGSCRDTAWLLVQLLRHLGLAARFASGYLIQLVADQKPLEGPAGPEQDFTDLHAWAEVYLPGAGWIGLDPTSGLLCGEGHLPLACTPDPTSAAPITGMVEAADCDFGFEMWLERIHEDPRTTKPFSDSQWARIHQLGEQVDRQLVSDGVELTMGGEPTFVSVDDMQGEEWNGAAVGPTKLRLSGELLRRLRNRFAPGGLLHFGQGKWYPGESLPRWALSCIWRTDGEPLWGDTRWLALDAPAVPLGIDAAQAFCQKLAEHLGVDAGWVRPAYEDVGYYLWREQRLPVDIDPADPKLSDPEQRARLARVYNRGLNRPVGMVLPLQRQWWQARPGWISGAWPVRGEQLFLLPGDSPVGLRLPLDSLPAGWSGQLGEYPALDPSAAQPPLPSSTELLSQYRRRASGVGTSDTGLSDQDRPGSRTLDQTRQPRATATGTVEHDRGGASPGQASSAGEPSEEPPVRRALCVEPREGKLWVFMPPTERLDDYVDLLVAIEQTCQDLGLPVMLEGYLPPEDARLRVLKVTPDPGVIEVNVQPSGSWPELVELVEGLYEEARQCRLGTEKFDLDGTHTGTGGGNHVVLGGPTTLKSPFLRRPDLLGSMIAFWNNHPSLSYLFSGRFVGPTSQAPRVDEGRRDTLYELQIALELLPGPGQNVPPWLVDRLLRNLLVDLTGNTHRAEFCIDKLYCPNSATGRLGLVELRALEMPPHPQMSLVTQLLIRCLVAHFWRHPYRQPLRNWGSAIHDRFLLPHYLWQDFETVIGQLQRAGWMWETRWFEPQREFRLPKIGSVHYDDVRIELRQAIEPWYVLGEEGVVGGTARYVDSSVERLEVLVDGLDVQRYDVLCNGYRLPLLATGVPNQWVCGVRYRAWCPPACLHPTIDVHTPLVFDLLDRHSGRSLGGCRYHVAHPGGRNYDTFPVNAFEAEARRAVRFAPHGHTPGGLVAKLPRISSEYPCTLDLRRQDAPDGGWS